MLSELFLSTGVRLRVSPGLVLIAVMSSSSDSAAARKKSSLFAYLVVLAVAIHHPVFSVCADLQLEGGDVVRLLRFLRDGALCGDPC